MAKTWTIGDWDDELHRKADEAVKVHMEKMNMDGYSETKKDAIRNELKKTALKKLKEEFKFSKLKDTERDFVSQWKPEAAASFLLSGGNKAYTDTFNPLNIKKQDDFQKLSPFILGVADEGRDWYNMGNVDLFDAAKKLGYDVSTKKGKMDFLRDVGDVQQAYDRGKLLEEFNSEASIFDELLHPTIMEEARKQISTGRGTEGDLYKAAALDAGINSAMFFAPSISNVGRLSQMPVRGGMAGAALQGALEGGRQGGKTLIDDDLEANMMAPILATTMGATRPGMIGTASTLSGQFAGRTPQAISKGITASMKRGNPTWAEREELETALKLFGQMNKEKPARISVIADRMEKAGLLNDAEKVKHYLGLYGQNVKLSQMPEARIAAKARPQLEALYGKEKADAIIKNGINAKQVLADYDNLSNASVFRDPYNFYDKLLKEYELMGNGTLREGDVLKNLENAFPAKMAEAYGNNKAYRFGLSAGKLLGEVGGRVEPIIKVNPFGPLSGGRINVTGGDDYKETKWYKSLSKKQQEAFDDAYEKSKKQAK